MRILWRGANIVAYLAGALAAMAVVLGLVLATGGLPLDPLRPWIEERVAGLLPDGSVSFEDPAIRWSMKERAIEIAARDIAIQVGEQDDTLSIAQGAATLSSGALASGRLELDQLIVRSPDLAVERNEDGGFELAGSLPGGLPDGPREPDMAARALQLLDGFFARAELYESRGLPSRLSVENARIVLRDATSGTTSAITDLDLVVDRASGAAALVTLRGVIGAQEVADAVFSGTLDAGEGGGYSGSLDLEGLRLAHARALLVGSPVASADLAFDGTLDARLARGDDEGPVGLLVAFALDLPAQTVRAPGLLAGDVAIDSGTFRGFHDRRAGASIARLDLARAQASASLELSASLPPGGAPVLETIEVTAQSADKTLVSELWPPQLASGARTWVVDQIDQVLVSEGWLSWRKDRETGDNRTWLDAALSDGALRYLDHMPAVSAVEGRLSYGDDQAVVEIASASSGGIDVTGGEVNVLDGEEGVELDIRLSMRGSARTFLEMAGQATRDELLPGDLMRTLEGRGALALDLSTGPIVNDGETDIRFEVSGDVEGAALDLGPPGGAITAPTVSVTVDNARALLEGAMGFADWPLSLSSVTLPITRAQGDPDLRFEARADLTDLLALAETSAVTGSGPVSFNGELAIGAGGALSGEVSGNLAEASLEQAELGLRKQAGAPATLSGRFDLDDRNLLLEDLSYSSDTATIAARVDLGFATPLRKTVEVASLRSGAQDFSAHIEIDPGEPIQIRVSGGSFDVRPVLSSGIDTGSLGAAEVGSSGASWSGLDVEIDLERIVFPGEAISSVAGTFAIAPDGARSYDLEATLPDDGGSITARTSFDEDGPRLSVRTNNAGGFLELFDVAADYAKGGTLAIIGRPGEPGSGVLFEGHVRAENFRVLRAPTLARVLTLASFQGLSDIAANRGMSFDRLRVEYVLDDKLLTLSNGRVRGSEIGFTLAGKVQRANGEVDFEGTIVPVYTLNRFIGRIPIIGNLLRGQDGVGAFAVTYSVRGPITNPNVSVNPLSVLVPGFLRDLFGRLPSDPPEPSGSDG